MRKPSQITHREIDLAAQRADLYGLLAIPQPKPRGAAGRGHGAGAGERGLRGLLYTTLAVVVLALAGMFSLRFAPIRFVGNDCDPRAQVCR